MSEPYLVITSRPDLDGARLQAKSWVQKKLAASVNILPKMDSIYQCKGELRPHRRLATGNQNRLSLRRG
jgi:uncharacterized protein involved in tolerance to divalent cations